MSAEPTGSRPEDEPSILPNRGRDESGPGWGDEDDSNDRRLIEERPPHWE